MKKLSQLESRTLGYVVACSVAVVSLLLVETPTKVLIILCMVGYTWLFLRDFYEAIEHVGDVTGQLVDAATKSDIVSVATTNALNALGVTPIAFRHPMRNLRGVTVARDATHIKDGILYRYGEGNQLYMLDNYGNWTPVEPQAGLVEMDKILAVCAKAEEAIWDQHL